MANDAPRPTPDPRLERIAVTPTVRVAVEVWGPDDANPVVLLPGGGQTRHSWTGTARVLAAQGWQVWSMDLRGHGDSDWDPDGDYSLDAFVADLRAVVAAIGRPPVLVGASLGGLTSLVAVAETPRQEDLARAVVLVDVAHRVEEHGKDRIGAFMTGNLDGFATLEEAADVIAAYDPTDPDPTDLAGLAKNLRQRQDGRWIWHWDPAFVQGRFGSPDETRSSVIQPDRLGRAADALALPALLVRGRRSDLFSQEGADEFLQRVPQAEFADVAGAGHMVAGDRNEIFNQAILGFLDRQHT